MYDDERSRPRVAAQRQRALLKVTFPVFLTEPTDPACTVLSFSSREEMQGYVEEIDVRNEEFRVWDANGVVLRLTVREGPEWLVVEPTDVTDREGLIETIRRYAAPYGVDFGEMTGLTAADLVEWIERAPPW